MLKPFIIVTSALGVLLLTPTAIAPEPKQKLEERLNVPVTPEQYKLTEVPAEKSLVLPAHYAQTFNNCGPATLSMVYAYWDKDISQKILGDRLRPYQIPNGDNDDKSVTLEELANDARNEGFIAYHRPNGNIELIKKFIANDIPVITRTWLNLNEDIGHYRIVRGYNTNSILQDDSYQDKNIWYSNNEFMSLWKDFQYEYLIVAKREKQNVVEAILEKELDEKYAWKVALTKAQEENNLFNQSVAHFHLGNYQASVEKFEQAEPKMSNRMLWYQIEPIEAYLAVGNYEKVFSLTDKILKNNNRAFSELYILRGKSYQKINNEARAQEEFQKAYKYNQYLSSLREYIR